jgi:Zn-dependent protease
MEPNQTPYDLSWRMFGIPVRVHPMFWLISAIMGWALTREGMQFLLVWIVCVFVSILIHELGHVWAGQVFGSYGHIVLYGFGGLAIGSNHLHSRWQRIVVCFAGPAAGFLFLGLIFLLLWVRDPELMPAYVALAKMDLGIRADRDPEIALALAQVFQNRIEFHFVSNLIFINLLWGLVNLLPVWPLDGGQISRDVCTGVSPDRGLNISLGLSLVIAGVLALHSFMASQGRGLLLLPFGSTYTAVFFAILALQSFLLLQEAGSQRRWLDDHWESR